MPKLKVVSSHEVLDGEADPVAGLPVAKVRIQMEKSGSSVANTWTCDGQGKVSIDWDTGVEQDSQGLEWKLTCSRVGYGTVTVTNPKKKYTLVSEATGQLKAQLWPKKVTLYTKG